MVSNPQRRDLLADAGLRVLATAGARGLTHRAVDREAGVPAGTASNYFRSRDALLNGLAERIFTRMAPTPDDLYWSQYLADLTGELAFEFVRRYGNVRLDHTVAAIQLQNDPIERFLESTSRWSFGWHVQAAGDFEPEQFAAAMAELAEFVETKIPVTREAGNVHAVTPEGEVALGAVSLRTWSKGMAGRAKPELARELLIEALWIVMLLLANRAAFARGVRRYGAYGG